MNLSLNATGISATRNVKCAGNKNTCVTITSKMVRLVILQLYELAVAVYRTIFSLFTLTFLLCHLTVRRRTKNYGTITTTPARLFGRSPGYTVYRDFDRRCSGIRLNMSVRFPYNNLSCVSKRIFLAVGTMKDCCRSRFPDCDFHFIWCKVAHFWQEQFKMPQIQCYIFVHRHSGANERMNPRRNGSLSRKWNRKLGDVSSVELCQI